MIIADYQHPTTTNTLDVATSVFLEGFSKVFESIGHLPLPEQRAAIKEMFNIPEDQLEPIARAEDIAIPGRDGQIHVRLFTPKNEGPLPVIVFFHRGGWVYGSIEECELICRRLANETGAIVASVEYRLSPEHQFPTPLNDCYDATQWIAKNASTFLGDPAKVILAGESAGGNLAAAVALMARDTQEFTVAGQLLMYPVLTSDLDPIHYENSPDKKLISLENMQFFWSAYLSSSEDGKNPLASPLHSTDLTNLPACFVITAEHDALKHEGERYSQALQNAGVATQTKCYPGVIHGFLDLPLADPIKKDSLSDIAAWIATLQ